MEPARIFSSEGLLHNKAIPAFASLRAFEAVGRLGGIRKAAAALDLDNGVISRHIKALEDWTGVALVNRVSGRIVLTEAGAGFHARVSAALVELASATLELMGDKEASHIKVWCIPGFAVQWLSSQLADFSVDFPRYRVELRPTDRVADLLAHEADVDVRFYGDDWPPKPGGKSLKFIELGRPLFKPVAHPELAARISRFTSASQLATTATLLHTDSPAEWPTWFRLNGITVSEQLSGPMLWHAHIAIAAACEGRGVALANDYLVGQELARGDLAEVILPDARPAVLGCYAFVAREDRWHVPPIMHLRSFLQKRAALPTSG